MKKNITVKKAANLIEDYLSPLMVGEGKTKIYGMSLDEIIRRELNVKDWTYRFSSQQLKDAIEQYCYADKIKVVEAGSDDCSDFYIWMTI